MVGIDPEGIVVTVNGAVAAVTETYGDGLFQALLAPRFFDRPLNRLRFFGIPVGLG